MHGKKPDDIDVEPGCAAVEDLPEYQFLAYLDAEVSDSDSSQHDEGTALDAHHIGSAGAQPNATIPDFVQQIVEATRNVVPDSMKHKSKLQSARAAKAAKPKPLLATTAAVSEGGNTKTIIGKEEVNEGDHWAWTHWSLGRCSCC